VIYGVEVSLDFKVRNAFFATSEGRLLEYKMLGQLAELDTILTRCTTDLQYRDISLKSDTYYRKLHTSIRGFVANEIGQHSSNVSPYRRANLL
jgi:hypothetical protein